jgi:hypothetical protein
MLSEAAYYFRTALGIRQYLRTPPHADAEAVIRRQIENRESIFLDLVRRTVFSKPSNPYFRMFDLAGCTFGDLARAVGRDGLEKTLAALHPQGVYLTHDEFKGKTPIVRAGREIPATTDAFLNPLVRGLMEGRSSGSTGRPTRTPNNVPRQLYREAQQRIYHRELGLEGRAYVEVKPILPSMTGLSSCLRGPRVGFEVERWFAVGGSLGDSGHYRWMTHGLVRFANLLGARAPLPAYLPPNDFTPVAEWVARRRAEGSACCVSAFSSPAVRIARAALEKGLDIRGTVFVASGEPLTDAKRALIEKAGAEVYVRYPISEIGGVGCACRRMKTGNRVHVFKDALAVISRRRRAPLAEVEVNALLFTTLLPFAPYVLINAEMGDSGVVEPVDCDCAFSRLGFTEQVRDISSFSKLTGQGMTLVGTDLVQILEEILPARLGGAPGDYQLVEHEAGGQTQLTLRVSPRAGISSPDKLKECFLKEIRGFYGGSLAARTWRHAESVDVVIGEPFTTSNGKVLSLHLLGSPAEGTRAS